MAPTGGLLTWILFALNIGVSVCWDNDDLELFDLVEEVNQNFYEVLGVEKDCSSNDVRRAYRRLSLQLHPDKNKEENAETKFRQMVAVYETLKDEDKRKRYELVLENGLPDWRQPVYYYRRVRKLGMLELLAFMCIILTFGQYLVLWSIFLEKKFSMEEDHESRRKKFEKKLRKNKLELEDQYDELQEEMDSLPRPKVSDLWPIRLTMWTVNFTINLPTTVRETAAALSEWKQQRNTVVKDEEDEDEEEEEDAARKAKKKARPEFVDIVPVLCTDAAPVVYTEMLQSSGADEANTDSVRGGEWTDEDLAQLSKAMSKYPGGSVNRWEKVAGVVNRTVPEVIAKSKTLKTTYVNKLDASLQSGGLKGGKKTQLITEAMISHKSDYEGTTTENTNGDIKSGDVRRRHKPKPKKIAERTLLAAVESQSENKPGEVTKPKIVQPNKQTDSDTISENSVTSKSTGDGDNWNKNQQTILEWNLRQYPKGTDQRWEKIAEKIIGKTKEDCMIRYKYLADLVKKKKELSQKQSDNS
ncbi:dnaJ homolog subfamily C member 1-like [Mizuhopecten yessoensis]|uniref:DnaJ-like subfamily C member 1 n=1 Tax=Mizuhopecten yessoensis TaxID=6573 RepID=A0A210R064_MIZYE|nr:dnaJ homolog subfamily C member 1-like [Mizuhopecten yessoensis]OWF54295.1 DnaJ-like subfamily C member 1 [Mizuhopecten yessoensis]